MKHLKYLLLVIASVVSFSIPVSAQEKVLPVDSSKVVAVSSDSVAINAADAPMEADINIVDSLIEFAQSTGFAKIFEDWKILVMLLVSFLLMYLAIVKKFEPLLLLPIAFGMMLSNLPSAGLFTPDLFANGVVHWDQF